LLESNEESFPSLNTHFEEIENEVSDVNEFFFPELNAEVAEEETEVSEEETEEELKNEVEEVKADVEELKADVEELKGEESEELNTEESEEEFNGVAEIAPEEINAKEEEKEEGAYNFDGKSDSRLSESIDKLIEEAKKRKVSETSDMNFLKFLNKSQVDSFYALTNEEQESVKLHINERSYFSGKEVLTLISEALSTKNESLEERVIRFIPENIKPVWETLNESSKKSILSQARLYPEDVLKNESQIEHFWSTRNLKKSESLTKKLVSETLIQEDKLSDNDINLIMERFKNC